jgi:hypothetical protein
VISYHSKSGRLRLGSLVGHFPAYLRFAGYDGLILTGKSEEPVTLHLGGRSRLTEYVDERSDKVPGHGGEGSFFEFDAEKEWAVWRDQGAGWAGELSSKKVKRFLLEPDGELPFPSDSGRLFSALSEELDTLSRGGEGRRSCFACAMACGRYEPSSQGWRLEGIKEEGTLSREDAKSWARALYALHGGYEDILFQEARSVSEWVEAENWAVIKNCLPVCGRWPMSPRKMTFVLNQITGSDFTEQELSRIGKNLIDTGMDLYRSLNYTAMDPIDRRPSAACLPEWIRSHRTDYLKSRGWGEDGFPDVFHSKDQCA